MLPNGPVPHCIPQPLCQVGWGFTEASPFSADKGLVLTPAQKREHLFNFWRYVAAPGAKPGG